MLVAIRLHASYDAKITKNLTPLARFNSRLIHNQTIFQKFERTFFDQVAMDAKSVLTFGGRAEIENIKNRPFCDIFNFSSATRGHFSNVDTLLASMATWSKKVRSNFWKTIWL